MTKARPDLGTAEWQKLRLIVLNRDSWQCTSCGKPVEGNDATVDHVVPHAAGGTNDMHNLVTLCRSCNSRKQDSLIRRIDWVNKKWLSHV